MDVYGYRKQRLQRLIALEFDGKKRRFADAMGMKPEQVYRWLTTNPKADTRRIEYESARKIEQKLGLSPLCLEAADIGAPYRDRDPRHESREFGAEILLSDHSEGIGERKQSMRTTDVDAWWPFPLVDRARFLRLDDAQQRMVQERMNEAITYCEATSPAAPRQKRPA